MRPVSAFSADGVQGGLEVEGVDPLAVPEPRAGAGASRGASGPPRRRLAELRCDADAGSCGSVVDREVRARPGARRRARRRPRSRCGPRAAGARARRIRAGAAGRTRRPVAAADGEPDARRRRRGSRVASSVASQRRRAPAGSHATSEDDDRPVGADGDRGRRRAGRGGALADGRDLAAQPGRDELVRDDVGGERRGARRAAESARCRSGSRRTRGAAPGGG